MVDIDPFSNEEREKIDIKQIIYNNFIQILSILTVLVLLIIAGNKVNFGLYVAIFILFFLYFFILIFRENIRKQFHKKIKKDASKPN